MYEKRWGERKITEAKRRRIGGESRGSFIFFPRCPHENYHVDEIQHDVSSFPPFLNTHRLPSYWSGGDSKDVIMVSRACLSLSFSLSPSLSLLLSPLLLSLFFSLSPSLSLPLSLSRSVLGTLCQCFLQHRPSVRHDPLRAQKDVEERRRENGRPHRQSDGGRGDARLVGRQTHFQVTLFAPHQEDVGAL